jgi:hypothetical protein
MPFREGSEHVCKRDIGLGLEHPTQVRSHSSDGRRFLRPCAVHGGNMHGG